MDNPEIAAPVGDVDERVNVLRFDREDGKHFVVVNFGNHPDVVGGSRISADWPGFLRETVEKVLDDTRCIFFNGAQGDVNHVNVHPRGGYLNDMFLDFDDVARGYGHARYMGRVVAAGVLQVYDKVKYVDVDPNYCNYVATGHPEYAKKFSVDDFAAAFVRLEGGIILDFRIAWAMNMDTPGDTIILGTKGGLRIPSTECWNGTVGGAMTLYHEVCGQQTETKIPVIEMKENLFDLKIRTFLDAIKEGGAAPVPSSQILYNQAIIDGINKSAALGREIEIEIPEI